MSLGARKSSASRSARQSRGGIRASSQRGCFAENWWGKRWIDVLESFPIGARLGRGKSYARKGQVLALDVGCGIVEARVQGSRGAVYRCHIGITPFQERIWGEILGILGNDAYLAAALLGGRVPPEIEEFFSQERIPLFPMDEKDFTMKCSCPDGSLPCKHLAAVFYLLGERLDKDPFLLFELRGLPREEVLRRVGIATESGGQDLPLERLPVEEGLFWKSGPLPLPSPLGEGGGGSGDPAALLRQLGPFPLWRGEIPLMEALEPMYRMVRERWR